MEELKELLIGFEQRMNEKFREIDEKFQQVVIELENNAEKIEQVERILSERINQVEKTLSERIHQVERALNEKIDRVEKTLKGEMKQLERTILDRQFLFETEYGKKIDMIYDAVVLELDKNLEKSEKIRKLDARMDKSEIKVFDHEKRISILERS